MKYPSIVHVSAVIESAKTTAVEVNGKWVPARALGFQSSWSRLRATWLVFTGRADALIWEAQ